MHPVILHVAPITYPQAAGLAFSVPRLAGSLHQIGVPTGLLTTSSRGPYRQPQSYPVRWLRDLPHRSPWAAMPAPLNHPDLIVFHSTYIPAHACLAAQASRRGIPYVITPRGGMTREAQRVKGFKKVLGNLLFFHRMVSHSLALHCLTEGEAAEARGWKRPVFVVGNAVELPPTESLARPGVAAGLRLTFLGRLDVYHKGLDLLLDACGLVQHNLRAVGAQVTLYGPDVAGGLAQLSQLSAAHRIEDLVYLLPPVQGEVKEEVLRQTDLFLHTSRFEGQPVAVLEAMSFGVPCLLTPGTNMAEELLAYGAGWTCLPNAKAIAEALSSAIAARTELARRGQAARKLVEREHAPHLVAMRFLGEVSTLLPGARCSSSL